MSAGEVARSWDREYEVGRYLEEAPVPFVDDILTAARQAGLTHGLYIGCGNGRNYLPLVRHGLDLVGLDISPVAIDQLSRRAPERRLLRGDLGVLPPDEQYDLILGIQIFQHGTRAVAHAHIRAAQEWLAPGGIMAIRVNAVGTDVWPRHSVTESNADGGFTVRYLKGAKEGLEIHFFSRAELVDLFRSFQPVLPLRLESTDRKPPAPGQWSQWEGIWRRPFHPYRSRL